MTTTLRPRWPALAVALLLAGGAMVLVGGSADADPVGGLSLGHAVLRAPCAQLRGPKAWLTGVEFVGDIGDSFA